jgi:hypothetical protein
LAIDVYNTLAQRTDQILKHFVLFGVTSNSLSGLNIAAALMGKQAAEPTRPKIRTL